MEEVQKTTEVVTELPQQVVKTTRKVLSEPAYETKKTIFRSYQVIWYILGVLEVLLAFRFVLKLLGANSSAGFTYFIYTLSEPFAGPFLGVVAPSVSGVTVLEWSTIIAMLVYLVIAYGIAALLQFIKPVTPQEIHQKVDA